MPVMDELMATPSVSAKDMPYVSFYTETIEDVKRTKAEGRMCYRDQDFALTTSPGGKSNNRYRIDSFFTQMEAELKTGRVSPDWLRATRARYELYKQGQEIPLEGTPIKGWKLLPGSVQEELVRLNIRTVEDLATLPDEGLKNVGMGAREWQRRAKAWLAQNDSHEGGALKLADLTRQMETLIGQVKSLTEKNDELERALAAKKK
jgi:hypothetical protein